MIAALFVLPVIWPVSVDTFQIRGREPWSLRAAVTSGFPLAPTPAHLIQIKWIEQPVKFCTATRLCESGVQEQGHMEDLQDEGQVPHSCFGGDNYMFDPLSDEFVKNGGSRTIEHIQTREGGEVAFNCSVDPPTNLTAYTLILRKVNDAFKVEDVNNCIVHSFGRNRDHPLPQMALYVNHTELSREGLGRGVVSVRVKLVLAEFAGNYRLYFSKLETSCFYNLTLDEKEPERGGSRGDLTTPSLPGADGTPSPPRGSGDQMEVWQIVLIAAAVAFFCAALLFLFLWHRGIIKCPSTNGVCRKTGEPRRQGDATEMQNLREGTPGSAENGSAGFLDASE